MADSLAGWVHSSLGKGHLFLGHRFLSQSVLVLRVLLGSASTYCRLYLASLAPSYIIHLLLTLAP